MENIITQLQTIEWSNFAAWLAIIIVAVPKIKKYLDDYESASGFQFPWTTKRRELNKRFEELDNKITKVDNRINTTRKEVEDQFNAIYEKEQQQHEVWHQQSITIRDNLAATQNNLAANQDRFQRTQEQFMANLTEISSTLTDIKSDLLDERLERKSWNILNCASKIRNGEYIDMEEYNNVFQDYDSYEDLIRKNGKSNGLIEVSIKLIREKYHEDFCSDKNIERYSEKNMDR